MIAKNQIVKVVTDRVMLPLIYGTTGKEIGQEFHQNGLFIASNNSKDSVTLCGSVVKVCNMSRILITRCVPLSIPHSSYILFETLHLF